jgi:methionine sulfoxide reductase heme-binding subunit
MSRGQPLQYLWWLVSDASGVVALALISLAVLLGLAMATKTVKRPSLRRASARLHQQIALAALAAITVHGLALLGDRWLKPGWGGITIPFALKYRPTFTGVGIIAGYLAMSLGLSFYLRRRIGARRWRTVHRATVLVWLLAVVHVLGAGSDASKLWLRAVVLAPVAPIVYLLVVRIFGTERARKPTGERRRHTGAGGQRIGSITWRFSRDWCSTKGRLPAADSPVDRY